MANVFDQFDSAQTGNAFDQFDEKPPAKPSTFRRYAADPAISLLKGFIGVPEAAVGIADLVSGGGAGRVLEDVGFRPGEAKAYLDTLLSPEQQEANRVVAETEGFFPTIGAALSRPSTIAHSALESLPSMGAGGVVARGLMKAAPAVTPLVAGAFGEGAVSAGQTAEQVRQSSEGGTLTPEQAAIAAGSGALTGVLGAAGGKVSEKLGITDIDTLIARGLGKGVATAKAAPKAAPGLAKRVLGGAFSEGVLEELPQSYQEQVAQNLATGKPWNERAPEAGAMGMLVGGVMGAGAGFVSQPEPPVATEHDAILREAARAVERIETTEPIAPTGPQEPSDGAAEPTEPVITPTPISDDPDGPKGFSGLYPRQLEALTAVRDGKGRSVEEGGELTGEDMNWLLSSQFARVKKDGTMMLLPAGRRWLKKVEELNATDPEKRKAISDQQENADDLAQQRPAADTAGAQPPVSGEASGEAQAGAVEAPVANAEALPGGPVAQSNVPAPEAGGGGVAPAQVPAVPQLKPIGEGAGALPANAPVPADWRQKWRTLEVEPGKWRIAGLNNANPFSPSFADEAKAEIWADAEWRQRADAQVAKPAIVQPAPPTQVYRGSAPGNIRFDPGGQGVGQFWTSDRRMADRFAQNGGTVDSATFKANAKRLMLVRVVKMEGNITDTAPYEPGLRELVATLGERGEQIAQAIRKGANTEGELTAEDYRVLKAAGYDSVIGSNIEGTTEYVINKDALQPAKPTPAVEAKSAVDQAAQEAAISPKNALPEPSKEQILAGNAKLGHPKVAGMDLSIESPAGSVREDKHNVPPKWRTEMKSHYGYVKGTVGFDKDHLDVFVKPGTSEDWNGTVYVVNQNKGNGQLDEHKAMIGFTSQDEARAAYLENYEKGWESHIRSVVPLPLKLFKEWAYDKTEKGPKGGELKPLGAVKDVGPAQPEQPSEPVTIFGKTVDQLTRKELEAAAKMAGQAVKRDAAVAELARRDAEDKTAPAVKAANEFKAMAAVNRERIAALIGTHKITSGGENFVLADVNDSGVLYWNKLGKDGKPGKKQFVVDDLRIEDVLLTPAETAVVAEVVADAETQVDPVAFTTNPEGELDKVLGEESRETQTEDASVAVPATEGTPEAGATGGETAVEAEPVAAAAEPGPAKPAAVGDRVRFTPTNKHSMVIDGEVINVEPGNSGQFRYTIRSDEKSPTDGGILDLQVWSNNGTVEILSSRKMAHALDVAFEKGLEHARDNGHKVNFEKPDYVDILQTYHQLFRVLLGKDTNLSYGEPQQYFARIADFKGPLSVENLRSNYERYVKWITEEIGKRTADVSDRYYGAEIPYERNAMQYDKAARSMRENHERLIEAAEAMNPGSEVTEQLKKTVDVKASQWELEAKKLRQQMKESLESELQAEVDTYVPFDPAQLEKPSMNEMGFTKGAAERADVGWIVAKWKGKDVYTDGHIVDVTEPPYKTWRKYLGKRNEVRGGLDAGKVIPADAKTEIKPVAFSTEETKTGVKYVLFDNGGGDFIAFDRRFVAYFLSKYPNAKFMWNGGEGKPALVVEGKKTVGLMMPIRWGTDRMGGEEMLRERFLGVKAAVAKQQGKAPEAAEETPTEPVAPVVEPTEPVVPEAAPAKPVGEMSAADLLRAAAAKMDEAAAPTAAAQTGKITAGEASAIANNAIPWKGQPGVKRDADRQKSKIVAGLIEAGLSKREAERAVDDALTRQASANRGGTMMFIQAEYLRDALRARGLLEGEMDAAAAPKEAATVAPSVKEPWQMTQDDYVAARMDAVRNDPNDPNYGAMSNYVRRPRGGIELGKFVRGLETTFGNEWFDANEQAAVEGKPVLRKPNWMMTRAEFERVTGNDAEEHEMSVKAAFEEGKPVPADVRAEYPQLGEPSSSDLLSDATDFISELNQSRNRAKTEDEAWQRYLNNVGASRGNPYVHEREFKDAWQQMQPGAKTTEPNEFTKRANIFWSENVAPALRDYMAAFRDFGAQRLESAKVKPEGLSATDWLMSFVAKTSTWDRTRKTGMTGIQALSQKDLWPTTDGKGEVLRKAMLASVKALKAAPSYSTNWVQNIEDGNYDGLTPAKPAEQAPKEQPAAAVEINTEDAGAELAYNRRNRIRTGIKWEDIADKNETLRVSETTKQNVYPRPDYDALIAGDVPPIVAHIVKQVYDSIAANPNTRSAPTDADLKTYIDGVNRVMAGVTAWARDKQAVGRWAQSQARVAGAMLGTQTSISELGKESKSLLETVYPDGWKEHRLEITIVGSNKVLRALQPGTDDTRRAIRAVEAGWPTPQKAWEKSFVIEARTLRNDDVPEAERTGQPQERFFIMQKASKWRLAKGQAEGGYASHEAAVEGAIGLTKREGKTQISDKGIAVESAERIGEARRMDGEDVSSDKLRDTFGFKGVNFGTWMKGDSNQEERQLHLNHAYDSFMDLADILGVPHKAMSLDGMLGVAIGAQGSGKYAAHFVPGLNEINLTRTSGAGSLAHEFGHAVDHYFATQAGLAKAKEPFLTEHVGDVDADGYTKRAGQKVKAFGEELRPEIAATFKSIVDAMNTKQETPLQVQARIDIAKAKALKQVNGWLAAIKRDFMAQQVDATKFDALAERIRTLDLGDGVVAAGNVNLSPVVDELRTLYKEKTGRIYSLDQTKGLQHNVDHAVYLNSDRAAERTHVPQQVRTDYATNAAQLDAGKSGKKYWSTNLEKFARAFDAFVSDTLAAQAAKNTYLSHADRAGETVPAGEERTAINKAFQTLVDTIETRETDKGVAMFAKGQEPGTGISETAARSIIGPITAKLKNVPPVRVVAEQTEIPGVAAMLRSAQQRFIAGDDKAVSDLAGFVKRPIEGAYVGGEIWLVAGNLHSEQRVKEVLAHEAIGHLAVEQMLDQADPALMPKLVRQVRMLDAGGNRYIKDLGTVVDKSQPGLEKDARAKEIIALIAERGDQAKDMTPIVRSMWQRIMDGIKAFFKLTFDMNLTDQDVRDIVASAERWAQGEEHITAVMNGQLRSEGVQFARSNQTDTPAFSRAGQATAGTVFDAVRNSPIVSNVVSAVMKSPASLGAFNGFLTQYHKAEMLARKGIPQFKAVFDRLNIYMNDINSIAVRAEQQAPAIFRELTGIGPKSMKTYFNGAASEKDINAIGPWLFHGTLYGGGSPMEGVVWIDDELRGKRGPTLRVLPRIQPLTDEQIRLYRQARAAIGQSLEDNAKAIIHRHVSKLGVTFDREQSLADVAETVREQLRDLMAEVELKIDEANTRARDANDEYEAAKDRAKTEKSHAARIAVDATKTALELVDRELTGLNTRREQIDILLGDTTREANRKQADGEKPNPGIVNQIEAKAKGLIDHGYTPLMRFGNRTVTARDADGNVKFFGTFDGTPLVPGSANAEMHAAAQAIRAEHPDWSVTTGVKAEKAWQMYRGLSLEALENFLDFLDPETKAELQRDAVIQEYLSNAVNNRSVLKRLIHRSGKPGFSTDVPRILASFVTSNARNASGLYHLGEAKRLVDEIPQEHGDVKDEAAELVKYVTEPGEEAAQLRSFLFFHFLGGSVAAAAVNMTQTVMMTVPYLSQHGKIGAVTKAILSAAKIAVQDPASLSGPLGDALRKAEADGVTAPQQIYHLTATAANNPFSSNRKFRAFMTVWGGMFGAVEVFNRRVAFAAAYDLAGQNGIHGAAAQAFATKAVTETQGIYSKLNRMNMGRGALGATVLTFKQFSVMYLELLRRLPPKQQLMMLGILLLAAGAEGVPFAEDIEDLVDTLGQWLGFSTNTGKWTGKVVKDVVGPEFARPILKGLGGMLPLDLHSRLGFGNLLPGTAFFKPSEIDKTRDVSEAVGPIGGVLKSLSDGLQLLARGKWDKAAVNVAPKAVRDIYNGAHMAATGESQDTKGRLALRDVTAVEGLGKAIGFNPQRTAAESEAKREIMLDRNLRTVRMDEIASDWADGILSKDPEKTQDARDRMWQWNKDNPGLRIAGTQIMRSVQERVRAARKTSAERFLKSTPKAMRPEAREALVQ